MPKNQNAKALKIGIDARLAYRRGVGTYVANLIKSLSKIDHRNRYFLFNAPEKLKSRVSNPNFHWVEVPFANAAYYEQILLPRAAAAQGIDLLHYVDNSATVIGHFPMVVTVHDTMHTRVLSEIRPNPTFYQRMIHAYKQWSIPRAAPRARAILTVSEFSRGQILPTLGIPAERVFVTPEGVDLGLFKKIPRKPSGLFKILVHGAADERKNLANILKAAKILRDQKKTFQLIVIGMDGEELKCTDYVQKVAELGLERQVEWGGNVPTEMLNQVYAEADLFLYPSRMEGFGLPLLEAFACGVPVITSNVSSLPEVAGKAALLVDPEDPRAIAKALRQMMERPALRKLYVGRGFRQARRFSWDKTARATLKVYETVGRTLP